MDSLLTLSIGDYRLVDLTLRLATALVVGAALLLGLSTMCVGRRLRFPLILGSVALLVAAWFESGIARAWVGAFELAGSSYCVTGLPLASEDRILAWAFGLPAILFTLGLVILDHGSKRFRNLGLAALGLAILGPVSHLFFLIGFIFCADQLRGSVMSPSGKMPALAAIACSAAILGMVVAILLTEAGHLHLLPLGKTADSILVRGEIIRSFADIFALALPGFALLVCILNLSEKEPQAS